MRSAYLAAVAVAFAPFMLPSPAKALSSGDVPYPSLGVIRTCGLINNLADNQLCLNAGYPPTPAGPPFWGVSQTTYWQWDPPAQGVTSIDFSFYFNPALFTPVPGSAGFLCGFSSSANCPVGVPGTGTQFIPFGIEPVTGPANGTQQVVIGAHTVSISAVFSSPVTAGNSDELFFAMAFTPLFSLDNAQITYSQDALPNADYAVLSYGCTTLSGSNNCGSDSYTRSFTVSFTPEPSSWAMMVGGFGLVGAAMRRRERARLLGKMITSAAAGS